MDEKQHHLAAITETLLKLEKIALFVKYTAIWNGTVIIYGMEIYRYEGLLVIYWNYDGIYGINALRDMRKDHGII